MRRVPSETTIVVSAVAWIAITRPWTIVGVVMSVPTVVVAIIEVPVVRSPTYPVGWVIAPAIRRTIHYVGRTVDVPDYWPGGHFVVGGGYHCGLGGAGPVTGVARVWGLVIRRLDDIVFAIQRFIANQLNTYRTVAELLYNKNSYILKLRGADGHTENYIMDVPFNVIRYHNIVYVVVTIQVQVVDGELGIVQPSFEFLKGL